MSAINKILPVRKNQAGISILELLLYVIVGAGIVLAAWFGLNAYLAHGKESSAKQILTGAYKVARTHGYNLPPTESPAPGMPPSEQHFPNKTALLPLLRDEFGVDKVRNLSNFGEASELENMQLGIQNVHSHTIQAYVRFSETKVMMMIGTVNQPLNFEVMDVPEPEEPDALPEIISVSDIEMTQYMPLGGQYFMGIKAQFDWTEVSASLIEECRTQYSDDNGETWTVIHSQDNLVQAHLNTYETTINNFSGFPSVDADIRMRCRRALHEQFQPTEFTPWASTPVVKVASLIP